MEQKGSPKYLRGYRFQSVLRGRLKTPLNMQPVLRNFRPPSPAHQGGHIEYKNAPPEWPNQLPLLPPPGGVGPCGEPVVTGNVFLTPPLTLG
jgi:hypothetical protein